MADVLLPTWLKISRLRTDYRDNTGLTRALYTAAPETTGFGGDRLRLSLEFTPTSSRQSAVERAALRVFLARLRGRQNRAYLWDPSYLGPRGSFPATELLTNNTFANGTTGWAAGGSVFSISVADRILRAIRQRGAITGDVLAPISAATVVQYAPYVARVMEIAGRGALTNVGVQAGSTSGGDDFGTSTGSVGGMKSLAFVPSGTTVHFGLVDLQSTGHAAGDYYGVPYVSLARCPMIDNAPNLALQARALETASWTAIGLSARNANAASGHDGLGQADNLVENSSNSEHSINQSVARASVAADLCSFGVFARQSGTRNLRLTAGNDSSNYGSAVFDLGAGTFGTVANSGAATNARAFMVDLGNGYFFCSVVARAPAAATAQVFVQLASGTTTVYTGDGTSSISGDVVGICASSLPTRGGETVASALAAGTSQTGNALHLKGLPASTSGLLLPDDRFEVITSRGSELKIVTASLDSDAAGLGYVTFEPPLLGIPSDNAPLIIHQPMTRAIFVGDMVGFSDEPGIITSASAEFEEAV